MAGLNLVPEFSEGCIPSETKQISRDEGYFTQRYEVTCSVPREERQVTIEGLTRSLTAQGRGDEAAASEAEFRELFSRADITLEKAVF